MPKFSIILPVYNGEQFLERCIKSILAQTFEDFELIIVDDGSKDNSLKICQKFAEQDNRVIVTHQKNGGVSKARNTGLEKTTGDFFLFIDSDDYIDSNLLEALDNTVEKNVLVHFGFSIVNGGRITQTHVDGGAYDLISGNGGEIWRCCFPSSLKDSICFDTEFSAGEDYLFHVEAFCNTKKIKIINKSYYFYAQDNTNSAMHKNQLANLDQQIKATIFVEELLNKHNLLSKENQKALKERKAWCKEQAVKHLHNTFKPSNSLFSRITHKVLWVALKRLYRWDY